MFNIQRLRKYNRQQTQKAMKQCTDFLVWGNNQSQLLSASGVKCLPSPVPLSLPFEITSMCASEKHVAFVTKQGQLYSYGTNLDGRLGVSTKSIDKVPLNNPYRVSVKGRVIRAESGFSHMCVLNNKMEVYAWGLGDYGALGTGEFKSRSTPTLVNLPIDVTSKLRQISCGAMHTAFLTEDGEVYCCGSNQYGELGVARPQKISTPIPVSFPHRIQQVSCGVFYTLLLSQDGKVYGMGNNKYGQLGTGHKINEAHPTLIRELSEIVKVTAGYHSGAIDKFGNLFIWGSGSFGELLRPRKFVLSVPIRDIAIRGFFGIAIGHTSKNENRIYSWGNNTFGELGSGGYEAAKQPQEIEVLRGTQITKVALGVNFAMVLLYPPSRQASQAQALMRQQEQIHNPFLTERRSVKGFQENYLNSSAGNQEIAGTNRARGNSFWAIESDPRRQHISRNSHSRGRQYERQEQNTGAHNPPDYHYSSTPAQSLSRRSYNRPNRESERRGQDQVNERSLPYPSNPNTARKDYEKLFLQLCEDYQILVGKYSQLEAQISQGRPMDAATQLLQQREQQLTAENITLKQELSRLNYEVAATHQQLRQKTRKNEQLMLENQRLIQSQPSVSHVTLSPSAPAMTAQVELEYNKLLTQKEQFIARLNLELQAAEQQYRASLQKLTEENVGLKGQIGVEVQKNRKIINEHQSLIDELEVEIKKSEQNNSLLREENDSLKLQLHSLTMQNLQLEQAKSKSQDLQTFKQKIEQNLKESNIKGEIMTERITELQIQLQYERQLNKKYQDSIAQLRHDNEQLSRQLTSQVESTQEKNSKIDNLKNDLERSKKWKKQADEKAVQIQQLQQALEQLKRKSREMVEDKEKQNKQLIQSQERVQRGLEEKIKQSDSQIERLAQENSRLEKEIVTNKQSINYLKVQVGLKEDEAEHTAKQKTTLERKVGLLNSELAKQIDEREQITKQVGEAKRQISKLRLTCNDLQNSLKEASEEKIRLNKLISNKQEEAERIKTEMEKVNEKAENLRKQNTLYRQQMEEVTSQLEAQVKLNEELAKANREFAESESEYNQRINELEAKVYELEDENRSYTPRYEALMIRNRELDDRNRELGEMVNKAIEIQAESYKNNILKEVELNTDQLISQAKQEQQFEFRSRRNRNARHDSSQKDPEDEGSLTKRGQNSNSMPLKEEPYSKMMKQRLSQHKRKVSESAQKLADILELDGNKSSSKGFINNNRQHTEDYEKLNSQMESFNNQKQEFMSKIHSFAEKLKIL